MRIKPLQATAKSTPRLSAKPFALLRRYEVQRPGLRREFVAENPLQH